MLRIALVMSVLLMGFSSLADTESPQNGISGQVIRGPYSLTQILNPIMTIGDSHYYIYGDDNSAEAACSILGKKYQAAKTAKVGASAVDYVRFSAYGEIDLGKTNDEPDVEKQLLKVSILVCKD